MSTATKDAMESLHKMLAETLIDRMKDPDVKAGDLNVARQFLKDNHIEGMAVENSPLADLVKTLPDFNDDDTDMNEMRH
jgi:Fe-S-cluster formation regulator IscX/YfhJ|tara:strand:+ start:1891 stop:2127 length:237 start_codon:yes stop_codon:yes gene_type:complete